MLILYFRNLRLFLTFFSSSGIFKFKLPPGLIGMKIQRKFVEIVIFCKAIVCGECLNQKIY